MAWYVTPLALMAVIAVAAGVCLVVAYKLLLLVRNSRIPNRKVAWLTRGGDEVEQPSHYSRLVPQPLDVIEAWKLDHHSACVVKYVARAGHKGDAVTDLRKAQKYLERRIAMLTREAS